MDQGGTSTLLPYKFTGKELDPETGLYYFGARYYDARASRWQSADPIFDKYLPGSDDDRFDLAGEGGVYDPRNLGLFAYGYQNPVMYRDPDGRMAQCAIGLATGPAAPVVTGGCVVVSGVLLLKAALFVGSAAAVAVGTQAITSDNGEDQQPKAPQLPAVTQATTAAPPPPDDPQQGRDGNASRRNEDIGLGDRRHAQHVYDKHGSVWDMKGGATKQNLAKLEDKLQSFIRDPGTRRMQGTYRGTQKVDHFYDPKTGRWVARTESGEVAATFRLSPQQLRNLERTGNVQ